MVLATLRPPLRLGAWSFLQRIPLGVSPFSLLLGTLSVRLLRGTLRLFLRFEPPLTLQRVLLPYGLLLGFISIFPCSQRVPSLSSGWIRRLPLIVVKVCPVITRSSSWDAVFGPSFVVFSCLFLWLRVMFLDTLATLGMSWPMSLLIVRQGDEGSSPHITNCNCY